MSAAEMKPRVLILGGVGFIGRSLVKMLVDGDLASYVRVCDKSIPVISYCSDEHRAALDASPLVEFMQCDLVQDSHLERAFDVKGGEPFDVVVNLAAETRFGMSEEVYKSKCLDLSVKCGNAAAAMGVKSFVEVSHGQVYKSSKTPCNEDSPIKPWTKHATYKHQAEEALRGIDGLPLVVLRLALVYGNGDVSGLMPRVVIAAAYKQLGETMKFLWGKGLKLSTVHVQDVCNAIWHVARDPSLVGRTYNVADKGDTDQGMVCGMLATMFGIKVGYHGVLINNAARLKMNYACEAANEKHLEPWNELTKAHSLNTPLSPYLDREVLGDKHLCVDGTKIEETGFRYSHPVLTIEALRAQTEYAIAQGIFPPVLGGDGESKS